MRLDTYVRALIINLCLILKLTDAWALPSFADQTGLPCATCHTLAFGPGLTAYGRDFKLNAYVFGDKPFTPLAVMQIMAFTRTREGQPDGAAPGFRDNNNFAPEQTSLFIAGRSSSHSGVFIQTTYDGVANSRSWSNIDLRYATTLATHYHRATVGLTVNNKPTVQDVWNSLPAWRFPYVSSAFAISPIAAPALEGPFAQRVLGASVYAMIDQRLYIESGIYRSLNQDILNTLGVSDGGSSVRGNAPYWRLALNGESVSTSLEAGIFGSVLAVAPNGAIDTSTNKLTDLGYDSSIQYLDEYSNRWIAQATYLHELSHNDASVHAGLASSLLNQLDTLRLNLDWIYQQTWSLSEGLFIVRGGQDNLLYEASPISGSANGRPDSRSYITQVEYVPFGKSNSYLRPWLNLRLGMQLTQYMKFNGSDRNYDGFGRSAHSNDTLYAFLWWAL